MKASFFVGFALACILSISSPATAVIFDVTGSDPETGVTLSGTIDIDAGTVLEANVILSAPGYRPFTIIHQSFSVGSDWFLFLVDHENSALLNLLQIVLTTPQVATLAGYGGGPIRVWNATLGDGCDGRHCHDGAGIVTLHETPIPGSGLLFGTSIALFGYLGARRRLRKMK